MYSKDWENFKKEILTKDQQTILDIKIFCRKLVENYKKYPVKVESTEQAMELGKALAADSILEIINNEQKL